MEWRMNSFSFLEIDFWLVEFSCTAVIPMFTGIFMDWRLYRVNYLLGTNSKHIISFVSSCSCSYTASLLKG